MSAKKPHTIDPAATVAANAALLAAAGLTDEDAPSWPVDATHPQPAALPAWAGLADASRPVDMGEVALRAIGVTSDPPTTGPGPFAPLGHSDGVPHVSLEGVERVTLVTTQESKIALAAPTPRRIDDDRPTRGPLGTDPLTQRIGAVYYLSDKVFDSMKDERGWRLHFTRWYPMQRVLVDFFRRPSPDVTANVETKIRHLRAHNAVAADAQIGYLPLYHGEIPDANSLIAACSGYVFDLAAHTLPARF
ncbi:MAG: hypothetical protein NVSMB19_23110 [Vulcanimicrobiaceae bacterium]